MRTFLILSLIIILQPSILFSGEPMSAIEWISKSSRPDIIQPLDRKIDSSDERADLKIVLESNLGLVSLNSIGILAAETLELPRNIWKESKESRLTELLENFPNIEFLEGNILLRKLLIAEASPPIMTNDNSEFLLYRLKNLVELGALEEVDIILKLADSNARNLLKIWRENAFLIGRIEDFCERILSYPQSQTEREVRILCLANRNQWETAYFILKSSIALGNLDRINQELLLVYLDPEFEIATNFSEKEIQSDITFYLSKVLSINFKEQHLPKKYYFYDLNNNYDLEKRLKAKEEYVISGLIPFSQILDELTETYYDLDIVNQLEFLNSNRHFSPKNKYEAENLQKLILYLSYEFDEPDLLIPFLKFFSKNMERAHKISPVEKATELFNLSYLMGESWLPISLKGINKHPDLVFAKNIKSKGLTKKMIENVRNCDKFCLAISKTMLQTKNERNERYRFRNPPKSEKAGEKLLMALALLSYAEESSPENISKGLGLILEAGQRRLAEKFSIELLIRRYLKKKDLEAEGIQKMVNAFKKQKYIKNFEVNEIESKNSFDEVIQNVSEIFDKKFNSINFGNRDIKIKGKLRSNKFSLELKHDF